MSKVFYVICLSCGYETQYITVFCTLCRGFNDERECSLEEWNNDH